MWKPARRWRAVIGEVEGPLTQEHVDEANRVIAALITSGWSGRRSEARVETREAVESVIGEVEGPLTQEHVDASQPRHRGIDNERLERQAFQARVETREAVESRDRGGGRAAHPGTRGRRQPRHRDRQ